MNVVAFTLKFFALLAYRKWLPISCGYLLETSLHNFNVEFAMFRLLCNLNSKLERWVARHDMHLNSELQLQALLTPPYICSPCYRDSEPMPD